MLNNRITRPRWAALIGGVLLLLLLVFFTDSVSALRVANKELYDALNLTPAATKVEVRKQFRKLTRENHPDLKETLNEKDAAKEFMAKILRAYEVLSDDKKRELYDKQGVILGEAPNPNEYSADEIFEFYHQKPPIFSRTPTLDSIGLLLRIMDYRGRKIHLLHIYGDDSSECRRYAHAWETMSHSGLVEAKVLEMFRVDALSPEGSLILQQLNIKYRSTPQVIAIIDGQKWSLYGINGVLRSFKDSLVFEQLLEFVMSFFVIPHRSINSIEAKEAEELVRFLQAPREKGRSTVVLFPKITAESIPLSLQILNDQLTVRTVQRNHLRYFVEEYCEMEIAVKDRYGDDVPLPEFIVVSTDVLPNTTTETGKKSCRFIHIGAAPALNYEKTIEFVKEYLPPKHEGMGIVPYLDDSNYLDVCRENCVIWARRNCRDTLTKGEENLVQLFSRNRYSGYATGYICLNHAVDLNSQLRPYYEGNGTGPIVLLVKDGADDDVYLVGSLLNKSAGRIMVRDMEAAIDTTEEGTVDIELIVSLTALLLRSNNFRMQLSRHYMGVVWMVFDMVKPYSKSVFPMLLMFLMQKFMPGRFFNQVRDNVDEYVNNHPEAGDNANAAAAGGAAAAAAPNTTNAKAPPAAESGNPSLLYYRKERDLKDAEEGKGFLLLVAAHRKDQSKALRIPLIAKDSRFTVRILNGDEKEEWTKWADAQLGEKTAEEAEETETEKKEIPVTFVAIRKQRMKAAVKPKKEAMDTFLRDLLDGTQPVTLELPKH